MSIIYLTTVSMNSASYSRPKRFLHFVQDIHTKFQYSKQIEVTHLDLFRALVEVAQWRQIYKLLFLNIDPWAIKWVTEYCTNHTLYVLANNASACCIVCSGVQQGSMLRKGLHLIFTNNLSLTTSSIGQFTNSVHLLHCKHLWLSLASKQWLKLSRVTAKWSWALKM